MTAAAVLAACLAAAAWLGVADWWRDLRRQRRVARGFQRAIKRFAATGASMSAMGLAASGVADALVAYALAVQEADAREQHSREWGYGLG